jgi:AraC-like DNA-binding protein
LAKIAVGLEQALARRAAAGVPGGTTRQVLAEGAGWSVADVLCTSGPQDRPFEEQHSHVCIALVAGGTFQYRSRAGRELMIPGSLLLGNAGQSFECGHDHGAGDHCLAFSYTPEYFENLAADAGLHGKPVFRGLQLPPLRELSPLAAQAFAGLAESQGVSWQELSIRLAAQTVQLADGLSPRPRSDPPSTVARVTRAVRAIEHDPATGLSLDSLAQEARLSAYHFLRTFQNLTGVTPHQYVLRIRLRQAAMRLVRQSDKILDVALDCGFGDVSNFNRAFRTEFGVSPRAYRQRSRRA